MKTLDFGASTSSTSINRQPANYEASKISGAEFTELDLRQFVLPICSSDEEEPNGIPAAAHDFKSLIESHDRIVISMP